MATPKPTPPSASLIPDLDVTASPGFAARAQGERTRGGIAPSSFGLLDDDLNEDTSQIALELAEQEKHASISPDAAAAPWPTGVTPLLGSLQVDSGQVAELCPWGVAPKALWPSVPYAIAVMLGRRKLRLKLLTAAEQLSEAEQRRDAGMAAISEPLLASLGNDLRLRTASEAARAAIAEYLAVAQRRDEVAQHTDAELSALREALVREQSQLTSMESQVGQCQAESSQAEHNLKREQARLQRLNIERRNLEQQSLPEREHMSRLSALKEQELTLVETIAVADRALTVARQALQHVKASAEASRAHVRELQRSQQLHMGSRSGELQTASALAQSAELRKRELLADFGRAVLAGSAPNVFGASTIAELRNHDNEIGALSLQHQALLLALDHFDRSNVKRGIVLMTLMFAAVLSGVVWLILG